MLLEYPIMSNINKRTAEGDAAGLPTLCNHICIRLLNDRINKSLGTFRTTQPFNRSEDFPFQSFLPLVLNSAPEANLGTAKGSTSE
ncbi:unnamed protein product [Eruca vesicaria subsp. sativa]|uniref:Uncharacterized protein n=1 Tax=Eruca vesicaria subsp. sativa TaxID=29727 RepID=A0ABC8L1G9_ERUVS|nr:unnamed protein product [Eruca vesicaria subsp. sativa]